jgi:hypothetical protein
MPIILSTAQTKILPPGRTAYPRPPANSTLVPGLCPRQKHWSLPHRPAATKAELISSSQRCLQLHPSAGGLLRDQGNPSRPICAMSCWPWDCWRSCWRISFSSLRPGRAICWGQTFRLACSSQAWCCFAELRPAPTELIQSECIPQFRDCQRPPL